MISCIQAAAKSETYKIINTKDTNVHVDSGESKLLAEIDSKIRISSSLGGGMVVIKAISLALHWKVIDKLENMGYKVRLVGNNIQIIWR